MKPRDTQSGFCKPVIGSVTAVLCGIVILTLGPSLALAQQAQSQVMTTTTPATVEAPKIPNDQLDSLVAPIALYSDELLAQTLAASTYPLEMIQLQQWLERNKNLKDNSPGRTSPFILAALDERTRPRLILRPLPRLRV